MADAIICVVIVVLICDICFNVYLIIENYEDGYFSYQERTIEEYMEISGMIAECQPCTIDDEQP